MAKRFMLSNPRHITALAGVAALSAVLAGCARNAEPPPPAAPPAVTVMAVASRPHSAAFEFIGQTEAVQHVDVRSRVTGFLAELAFVEGSEVGEGDLLFHVDPAEFDTVLAAAKAGLERAQAALLQATQHLDRARELEGRGTVSKATLDDAIAAESGAAANVAAAEADVARAELNLSYTRIHAPLSGRIGGTKVDAGNLIGPDTGVLATVVALDPMRVVFSISEQILLQVQNAEREGNARAFVPMIRFTNGETYDQPGEIQFIDNQVDPNTGTIRVFADFPNADGHLLPGLFVTAIMSAAEPEERILVPQAAVQLNQSGSFVLLVDGDGRAETRPIVTGERAGADIVVSEGLSAGETLIVEGIQKVRPGAEVTAVPLTAADG